MYDPCLSQIEECERHLQEMKKFIEWLEEDAVYVIDEKDNWALVVFSTVSTKEYKPDNYTDLRLPEKIFFRIIASDDKLSEVHHVCSLCHKDQWRMRRVPKKEWPLFMKNPSRRFEMMIRKGRFVTREEFKKAQAKQSS